jgi:hypothetical protein
LKKEEEVASLLAQSMGEDQVTGVVCYLSLLFELGLE